MANETNIIADGIGLASSEPELLQLATLFSFLESITASMAWPVVVLVIAVLFRKSIPAALGSLKSLKVAGAEVTFGNEIRAATETATALEPAPENIADRNNSRVVALIDMAAVSPSGAIIEAWKEVEHAAKNLAESSGLMLQNNSSRPYFNIQRALEKDEQLPKAEIQTYRELRLIRNRAAHLREDQVTVEQARQYVRLADRLVDAMNTLAVQAEQ